MLMALGTFVFDLPRLAYQQLEQQMSWRHAASERVGARPLRYSRELSTGVVALGLLAR